MCVHRRQNQIWDEVSVLCLIIEYTKWDCWNISLSPIRQGPKEARPIIWTFTNAPGPQRSKGRDPASLTHHYSPPASGGNVIHSGKPPPYKKLVKEGWHIHIHTHLHLQFYTPFLRATNLFSRRRWIGGQSLAFFSFSGHILASASSRNLVPTVYIQTNLKIKTKNHYWNSLNY